MYKIKQIEGSKYYIDTEGVVTNSRGKVRKPCKKITGYLEVNLYMGCGKYLYLRVHRLVAEHFIPNPENKPYVNHINGNKQDNRVSNLEWVTHQENMEHAKNHGLVKRAENNTASKITTEQAESICKMIEFGYRNVDISNSLGISTRIIGNIRCGNTWTHVSCKYKMIRRSRALSDETVRWVCNMLEKGLSVKEILNISTNKKLNRDHISDIKRRCAYTDISKDYSF